MFFSQHHHHHQHQHHQQHHHHHSSQSKSHDFVENMRVIRSLYEQGHFEEALGRAEWIFSLITTTTTSLAEDQFSPKPIAVAVPTTTSQIGLTTSASLDFSCQLLLVMGCIHFHLRNLLESLSCYERLVAIRPLMPEAHCNLGAVFRAMGRLDEALACYCRALTIQPQHWEAVKNYCKIIIAALEEEGSAGFGDKFAALLSNDSSFAAIQMLERCSNTCPAPFQRYYLMASLYSHHLGRQHETVQTLCLKSLECQVSPEATQLLGRIYCEKGLVLNAIQLYEQCARICPDSNTFNNLGILWNEMKLTDRAITCYRLGLQRDPCNVFILSNLGSIYKDSGNVQEAMSLYRRALSINPHFCIALCNLANTLKDLGRVEESLIYHQKALAKRPNFPDAFSNYVHSLHFICNWDNRLELLARLEALTISQLQDPLHPVPAVLPFHAFIYPFKIESGIFRMLGERNGARISLLAARALSSAPRDHRILHGHNAVLAARMAEDVKGNTLRLRVGYVSSDFGDHPLAHLMQSLFGFHNRDCFHIACFALSPSDGSSYRRKIEQEAETFVDISGFSLTDAAAVISSFKPHILVNLNGFTKGGRNELFAMELAPIQASYMGYAATMGMTSIPWLISDKIATPPQTSSHFFSETIVYLDRSYFCTDHRYSYPALLQEEASIRLNKPSLIRDILFGAGDRALFFNPDSTIIFANFNQLYKIDPEIFSCWMRILQRVPNSVLWLLQFPAAGQANLEREAAKMGVNAKERLVFTAVAPKKEHIWRGVFVDLFLDTPACNAHTTAADILWAGTPALTLSGEKMSSRVAASLLHTMGLDDILVSDSLSRYEETAVSLALNPATLENVKSRVRVARLQSRLFDTQDLTRSLETVYTNMYNETFHRKANNKFY